MWSAVSNSPNSVGLRRSGLVCLLAGFADIFSFFDTLDNEGVWGGVSTCVEWNEDREHFHPLVGPHRRQVRRQRGLLLHLGEHRLGELVGLWPLS